MPASSSFSGESQLVVPLNGVGHYTVIFKPRKPGTEEVSISFTNIYTGHRYTYLLRGIASRPDAFDTLNVDCEVRQVVRKVVMIRNFCDREVTYKLTHDSSVPVFFYWEDPAIPSRNQQKKTMITLNAGEVRSICVCFQPLSSGKAEFAGEFTSISDASEVLWIAVKMNASPVTSLPVLNVETFVREPVLLEIPIENPLSNSIDFAVDFDNDDVVVNKKLSVPAREMSVLSLVFHPGNFL